MLNNQNLWYITSEEKVKFDLQFQSLNPVNGYITGNQAKSLFTKSNLPTDVLGKIWSLADYDKDGRMNNSEFSIAMHLIKRRLEGQEVPDSLPPPLNPMQMSASPSNFVGYVPTSNAYNTIPVMQNVTLPLPLTTMSVQHTSAFVNYSTSSTMKFSTNNASFTTAANAQFSTTNTPFATMNQDLTKTTTISNAVEEDWSIPQAVRPRYRLQFNQQDRNKRGFLTGVEAKAILVQSGLPNSNLAQIWSLADIDQDGNLTCEEFCIAMHLVEQSRAGRTLPNQLPQSLLPPSLQKKNILNSSMPSSDGTFNTITNGVLGSKFNQEKEASQKPVLTGEDERRANYLKGQAELAKRRAILEEQMRQEEESRKAKEKAEFERLEKIRLEKEQAKIIEMQRQMEIRRQKELEREEQLRRIAEEREKARLESEKKRLLEMEKRRLEVAITERRQEQENLLEINSKKGNLIDALANEKEKKRDLQNRIESTQMTLETYKAGIGSMREHRDKLIDTTDCLREELEAAKAELSRCQREKQNLELQLQSNLQSDPVLEQIKTVQALKNSHRDKIKVLDKEIKDLEQKMTNRGQKLATNRNKVRDLEKKVTTKLISDIKKLQNSVCEKKNAALSILKKQTEPKAFNDSDTKIIDNKTNPLNNKAPCNELVYYEAVYAFEGRQHDELSFKPGDVIIINMQDQIEPTSGWLYGWLENTSNYGLFPEIYVKKLNNQISTETLPTLSNVDMNENVNSQDLSDVFNSNTTQKSIFPRSTSFQWAESIYPWKPESIGLYGDYPNQLSFDIGQKIKIIDKNLYDWWTGEITVLDVNGKENVLTGWFPRNYVHLLDETNANNPESGTVTPTAGSLEDLASKYSSLNFSMKYGDSNNLDNSGPKLLCVARYPYQASVLGDLNIQPGDIIEVIDQKQDWWKGNNRNTGLQGLFPSNYVKVVSTEELASSESSIFSKGIQIEEPVDSNMDVMNASQISVNSTASNLYSTISDDENNTTLHFPPQPMTTSNANGASTPEIAQVIIDFNPSSAEQIPLQVGQLVQVTEKSSSGWWKGEIQQRGQQRRIGWFPGQYVNIINSSQAVVSDSITPPNCTTPTPMSSLTYTDNMSNVIELNDSQPGDHLITMYNYSAQNIDELSFDKNVILVLIDKNEPEWWMGRNLSTAQEGLFPVNYVRRLQAGNVADEEAMKEVAQASSQYNVSVAGRPVSWYVDGSMTFQAILTDDEKRRQFYIRELIETEKVYYDDLLEVHQIFYEPIKKSNILTADELKSIFLNWSDLIPNSYNFFMALKIRKDLAGTKQPIQSVGDILLSNFPNFIVYVRFCSMQNQAIAKLQKKQQQYPKFKELCEDCESNLRCQKMPMTSYFLKPMQRITKYKLLVENILKHTDENHPDRSDMEEAVAAARSLCESVNEGVRERENSERLEWLQEHIQCDNLSEKLYFNSNTNCLGHRKLIYSGSLSKFKSGKELVGFLFNDFFLLATPCYNTNGTPFVFPLETSSKDKMQFKMYKKPIILNQVMISAGSPTTSGAVLNSTNDIFTVKEPNFEHILRALSKNDRDKWVDRLMTATMFYIQTENLKRECSMSIRRSAGVGRLLVTVIEGINLRASSSHKDSKSDPFCEVSLGNQLHRTKVISSTLNPKWNSQMQFLIKNVEQDVLCLTIYNKDYFAPNDFLGRIEVSVSHVVEEKRSSREPIEKRLKLMEVDQGELIVKLDLAMFKKN